MENSHTLALQKDVSSALSYATSNGYQVHPDAFAMLKGLDIDILKVIQDIIKVKTKQNENSLIIVEDIKNHLNPMNRAETINVNGVGTYTNFDNTFLEENVHKVISDSSLHVNTGEGIEGYTALFRSRFEKSFRILALRPDSKRITKISSIKQKVNDSRKNKSSNDTKDSLNGNPSSIVAGLLMSKHSKKSGLEITVDDYTGTLSALAVSEELKKQVSMLALDQMVMVEVENVTKGIQGFIVKNLASPDIPDHISNKSKSESYAVLISDLHVGSKYFLESEFVRFLNWLSSTNDEVVRKIRFICIGGDLIDGIGIFPNQDKELLEMNTAKQMTHAIDLLAKIPKHIKVFLIPGNHDLGRRALPQPSLSRKDSGRLYTLDNFTLLGNPSLVELNGVKVLMYHGQSLDDIIATTPSLSYSKPSEAMKILLKARHLSPIYGQRTPIAPEHEDIMVITEVPDIFHSGHIHIIDVQNYRGTLIVNSGAWQAQTKFQQTVGIVPTPGIAILINLATLQPFQMDFNQSSLA
jgi:DNA polymerase II small subunit